MNVTIVVFSTSGKTLKTANMLEEILASRDVAVQKLELSRNDIFAEESRLRSYLQRHVEPHDVLCIGAPVYCGHLQYHARSAIKVLPQPDNKWGRLTIPFVTWGGIDPGVALFESASLLRKSGRKLIAGMEIVAEHQMTRDYARVINPGLPGDEIRPFVNEMAERIIGAVRSKPDNSAGIMAQIRPRGASKRLKAALTGTERLMQRMVFPDPALDRKMCIGCGVCVRSCPVQRLELSDGQQSIKNGSTPCIHCYECVRWCAQGAITCTGLIKLEKFLSRAAQEQPQDVVYPFRNI